MPPIAGVHACEILDSRGYPTVEVDLALVDGSRGARACPLARRPALGLTHRRMDRGEGWIDAGGKTPEL